ncbi:prepilin-type N-terminal cleavage/methylation domain-containing protein [Alloalcanivorax marinus]|uniref:prepilin-type N-terminal cleavage/methylation domain-containing protein n=1 Tax=Alloalcanivorax marinus TaxID=1177169 RepID=UPI0023689222|nr:prepilin-type N-terminal cleavage/methylation domain-containing protein [Alloalcanivorax marinus]
MGVRRGARGSHRQGGFTLLEILVVVGLIAMLSLAVLVVPVWMDDERQLDGEVARLTDTLTLLNEQSLFGGRLMALRLTDQGWTPLVYDVGARQFVPAQGNGLQARRLPAGLELAWQFDDLPADEEERMGLDQVAERLVSDSPFGGNDDEGRGGLLEEERARAGERSQDEDDEDDDVLPQVFFFPSGETTPLTLTLRSSDDIDLEVRRRLTALGQVRDPDNEQDEEALTAPDDKPDDDDRLIDDDFLGGDR